MKQILTIFIISTLLLATSFGVVVFATDTVTPYLTPLYSGLANLSGYYRYYDGSFRNSAVTQWNWREFGNPVRYSLNDNVPERILPQNTVFLSDIFFSNVGEGGKAWYVCPTTDSNVSLTYSISVSIGGVNSNVIKNSNILSAKPTFTMDNLYGTDVVLTSTDYSVSVGINTVRVTGRFDGQFKANVGYTLKGWAINFPFYIDIITSQLTSYSIVQSTLVLANFSFPFDGDLFTYNVPTVELEDIPTYDDYSSTYLTMDDLKYDLLDILDDNTLNIPNSLACVRGIWDKMFLIPPVRALVYISLAIGLVGFVFTGLSLLIGGKKGGKK